MSDMNKNQMAYDFLRIQTFINVMTSITEAVAWAAFGTNPIAKGFFIAWAIAMVWARPHLAQVEQLALERADERAAGKAKTWLNVTILVTGISLFSLYSEAMMEYKAKRVAESAPVQLAAAQYEEQKQKLANVSNGYNEVIAQTAMTKKQQLEAILKTSRSDYDSTLATFWNKKHSNGLMFSEITDELCTPKNSKYGVMKTAAKEVCAQIPQPPEDIKVLLSEIQSLDKILVQHQSVIAQKSQLQQAEQALLSVQKGGNINTEVLPPVFHRLSELLLGMGVSVSTEQISSLLAILVILCILNLQSILQVTRTSIKNPNGTLPPAKPSLFDKLLDLFKKKRSESPVKPVQKATVKIDGEPELQPVAKNKHEHECEYCGESFIQRTPWHKYCSDACRAQANDFIKTAS